MTKKHMKMYKLGTVTWFSTDVKWKNIEFGHASFYTGHPLIISCVTTLCIEYTVVLYL
jgi:hypothetical protein